MLSVLVSLPVVWADCWMMLSLVGGLPFSSLSADFYKVLVGSNYSRRRLGLEGCLGTAFSESAIVTRMLPQIRGWAPEYARAASSDKYGLGTATDPCRHWKLLITMPEGVSAPRQMLVMMGIAKCC